MKLLLVRAAASDIHIWAASDWLCILGCLLCCITLILSTSKSITIIGILLLSAIFIFFFIILVFDFNRLLRRNFRIKVSLLSDEIDEVEALEHLKFRVDCQGLFVTVFEHFLAIQQAILRQTKGHLLVASAVMQIAQVSLIIQSCTI